MPRLADTDAAVAMFAPYRHFYDIVYHAHACDVQPFVDMAGLVPGENVLDLGTGSGWVAVEAKRRVGHGLVIGVDVSNDMLEHDARRNVECAGFKRSGEPATLLRLMRGDITSQQTFSTLRAHRRRPRLGFHQRDRVPGDGLPLRTRSRQLRRGRRQEGPGYAGFPARVDGAGLHVGPLPGPGAGDGSKVRLGGGLDAQPPPRGRGAGSVPGQLRRGFGRRQRGLERGGVSWGDDRLLPCASAAGGDQRDKTDMNRGHPGLLVDGKHVTVTAVLRAATE